MRNVRLQPFLLALLLGLSAFGMGCRQSEEPQESEDRVAVEQNDQQEPEIITDDPELQPEQRVVVVEPETGEDAGARQDLAQDLNERERRLAERNAELDARERRLQDAAERQARLKEREQAPKPAPRVESEEPVREEPLREPVPTEEVADVQDDEAEREAEEPAQPDREEESLPAPLVVNVPAGTVMEVELLEGLSSRTSEPGDIFRVRVASDVSSDGVVGIPAGSEIVGVVTEAVPLGKIGGRARLGLKLTDLVLPSGKTVPINASLVQQGSNETRKDAATIGGAAAGGAILGRVLNKKDRSKGTVIGAIIGAAAGAVLASRNGEEVVIPEGTRLDVKLDDEVEVRARQGR